MPATILSITLPIDVVESIKTGLPGFQSIDANLKIFLVEAANGAHGERLEVVTLRMPDALPGGAGLRAVYTAGWRVATQLGGGLAADCYTMARGGERPLPNGTSRVASVRYGSHVEGLLNSIEQLKGLLSAIPSEPYHLKVLNMPELFTQALLLEPGNLNPNVRWVFPYRTLIEGFPMYRFYNEAEFLSHVGKVATYWQSNPKIVKDFPAA